MVTLGLEVFTVIYDQKCFKSKFLSDQTVFSKAVILKNMGFDGFLKSMQTPTNAAYKASMLCNFIRYSS